MEKYFWTFLSIICAFLWIYWLGQGSTLESRMPLAMSIIIFRNAAVIAELEDKLKKAIV